MKDLFIVFGVMSTVNPKSLKRGLKNQIFVQPQYDPDLSQNFIAFCFGQALPTLTLFHEISASVKFGVTTNPNRKTPKNNLNHLGGDK